MLSQEAQAVELLVKEAAAVNQPIFFQYLSAKLEQLGVDPEQATLALEESFYKQPNEDLINEVHDRVEDVIGSEPLLEDALEKWHEMAGDERCPDSSLVLLHLIEVLIYTNDWYEAGVSYLYAIDAASKNFVRGIAVRLLAGEELLYEDAVAETVPSVESLFSDAIRELEAHLSEQFSWQSFRAMQERKNA